MAQAQVLYQPDYYSIEEYLALEEAAEFRNEYHDGEIFSMAGGTTNHNRIAINLCTALDVATHNLDCQVYMSDVKLWIPKIRRFLYPDVMITADPPIYYQKRKDTITNPLVIVEVLSKSTRDYDRTDKFKFYRTLPSFQEYLLISPWEFHVEQYVKTPTLQWLFSESEGPEVALELKTIPFQIPLKTLYKKVDFEEES
jgi:Uma2 family endonuclease